jgi:hypothetical protein
VLRVNDGQHLSSANATCGLFLKPNKPIKKVYGQQDVVVLLSPNIILI